jgi:hypothetical protein
MSLVTWQYIILLLSTVPEVWLAGCVCERERERERILYFYCETYKLIFLVQFWIIDYFNFIGYFNVDE